MGYGADTIRRALAGPAGNLSHRSEDRAGHDQMDDRAGLPPRRLGTSWRRMVIGTCDRRCRLLIDHSTAGITAWLFLPKTSGERPVPAGGMSHITPRSAI